MTTSPRKVALVTGGNKGIGFAICRALAKHQQPKFRVLLGSRDDQRGKEAAAKLKSEGLDVTPLPLDIDSADSVTQAVARVREQYGGLDVLVNNAGIASKGDAFDGTIARNTIDTNYYGTKRVTEAFRPLLRPGARVSTVSSMSGRSALQKMTESNRAQFMDANLTEPQLDALMEQFIDDVSNHRWEGQWPKSAYGISKAGHKTIDEGAKTPVMLALLPQGEDVPTGGFFEDEQQKPFV